jgi:hypothetical protein
MNLYLLTQTAVEGYDTYDSCVVAANTEEDAREIDPGDTYKWHDGSWHRSYSDGSERSIPTRYDWCLPQDVAVKLIGTAAEGIQAGTVICASFNAG